MEGYVHSIETFGTVDGPGIRFVVFLQGCPLRCKYCHNPDTWKPKTGNKKTVDEIINEFEKKRDFYKSGGITVTGGEPLLQTEFVTELFRKCKERDIHTCLDTSGITYQPDNLEPMDTLMKYTDLVMLDIKHIDNKEHKELTGVGNEIILEFAKYLDRKEIPVWIRHVVVPTITQNDTFLYQLGRFIGTLHNVKALDVLPYHDMGKVK
ncbi:MAG: pyruvate formate-lyase-activating protein, partial [Coprobacillaceae bacterium]